MEEKDLLTNCYMDKLIILVKEREIVWNYKCSEYHEKERRYNSWIEICKNLVPDFEEKSIDAQRGIVAETQNKWKVLRDGFSRNYKKIMLNKLKGGQTKKSLYFNRLLFLKDLQSKKVYNYHIKHAGSSQKDKESAKTGKKRKKNKDTSTTDDEDAPVEKHIRSIQTSKPESTNITKISSDSAQNEDKLFLFSLLKDFSAIPEKYKLDAKFDIINILRRYRNQSLSLNESQSTKEPKEAPAVYTVVVEEDASMSPSQDSFNIKFEPDMKYEDDD